jgi:hypothetical protein
MIYACVVLPVDSRTLATLRLPEFGFLGLATKIWVTTPLHWGAPSRRADRFESRFLGRTLRRTAWLSVRWAGDVAEKERMEGARVKADSGRGVALATILGWASAIGRNAPAERAATRRAENIVVDEEQQSVAQENALGFHRTQPGKAGDLNDRACISRSTSTLPRILHRSRCSVSPLLCVLNHHLYVIGLQSHINTILN